MAKIKNAIRGDSKTITLTCTNSSGGVFDLTGYTVYFTLAPTTNDTDVSTTDTTAVIQKQVTGDSTGIVNFSLTATDMNIPAGIYYYDIQLKSGSGVVTSVQADTFQVIADVTRRTS